MSNYAKIRKSASRGKYASGGRVNSSTKGAKTVINIVTPPAAAAAPAPGGMPMPGAPAMPAVSPSAGPPVPPAAAQMALGAMQGKPGVPGAFARGGRVMKGGAESGVGRLQKAKAAKK